MSQAREINKCLICKQNLLINTQHDCRQNKNTHNVCVYAFVITCIISIESQAFHVTENSDKSGLIFTNIHNVSTIESYKNLEYRINLADLYNKSKIFEQNLNNVSQFCQKHDKSRYCNTFNGFIKTKLGSFMD